MIVNKCMSQIYLLIILTRKQLTLKFLKLTNTDFYSIIYMFFHASSYKGIYE
jgi:hypothetical protein